MPVKVTRLGIDDAKFCGRKVGILSRTGFGSKPADSPWTDWIIDWPREIHREGDNDEESVKSTLTPYQ